MNEFPTIEILDINSIKNIIRNAIKSNCFNDDPNPQTRYNTTEVIIYGNTILASPINNNQAVGETVHDFISLGNRCREKDIGKQVVDGYKTFLDVPDNFKADTDEKVYDDALKNIIGNPDISILTLDDNEDSMRIINNLLQHSSGVSGHVTSNSVENSQDSVEGTPMYGVGSPFTPESVRNQYLDLIRAPLPRLREGLHSNKDNININTDLDSKNKTDYRNTLNEIFKNKCNNVDDNSTSMFEVATDHGAKKLPQIVQVDKYSIFNTMYDRGTITPETVDPKLLNLSYVYYSRNPRNNNIRGLLIVLVGESHDKSNGNKSKKKQKNDSTTLVNVKMFKYLFSCDDIECNNLEINDVTKIAPNVATLCDAMNNRFIHHPIDVALMKAAADRTLKIGALLSSVGLTDGDTISFLTHDIKNYYYNKNLYVKKKNGDFQPVELNAHYTSVYNRPPENCSRRILISQYKSKVDPELQKLINNKSTLTKKRETLLQEIEKLNKHLTALQKLTQDIDSLKTENEEETRKRIIPDVFVYKCTNYFDTYLKNTSEICPDNEFNNSLNNSTETIRRAFNSSSISHTKEKINEVFNSLSEKVGSCINSVNETITTKNEELAKCNTELELTNENISYNSNNVKKNIPFDDESSQKEKGGKEIGGRRTKRSIKVITKRKIKVKSKTIKKKSRRRNKTRRQRKKL